jgi:hypothetical protein
MTYHHAGNQPIYAPNSYGGPQADPRLGADLVWETPGGGLGRYPYDRHTAADFVQAHVCAGFHADDGAYGRCKAPNREKCSSAGMLTVVRWGRRSASTRALNAAPRRRLVRRHLRAASPAPPISHGTS